MIQKGLGRLPDVTKKQILRQTGNSARRLVGLVERLRELKEANSDCWPLHANQ